MVCTTKKESETGIVGATYTVENIE